LQFLANYRQGRLSPHYCITAPLILTSCLSVSYLSRFRTDFYQRHRNIIAVCWRLSALLWPSFLIIMWRSPLRSTQKIPIMTAVFGSSLLANVLTSICMPLLLTNSFIVNVLLSIRYLFEQFHICNNHPVTCASAAGLATKFWDILALLNPFGLGNQVPPVDVLTPPQQCFLVLFTSELGVLAVCWWAAWCIERQSRMRYLRQMQVEELVRKGGKQELFDLLLNDPLGVGVRITCFLLFGISLMWAGVLRRYVS
jgi:hypothetical protein